MRAAAYICSACGGESPKWLGRCPVCQEWNSLSEEPRPRLSSSGTRGGSAAPTPTLPLASFLGDAPISRIATGIASLDRVLGGGLVSGMGVLIGGEPGIGKSTLLLQCAWALETNRKTVLYATGEESGAQIALRARRLGVASQKLLLLPGHSVERILQAVEEEPPDILIVDSIQTIASESVESAPGSLSQVRECAVRLLEMSKRKGTPLLLVGHVTKDGSLAGPKALEHLVDTVIYFEGDGNFTYRMLRTAKNRFGPAGELAVFEMAESGLIAVDNPSALFLAQRKDGAAGSVVFCSLEGSLPFLVEIQALVVGSSAGSARRWATGFDPIRSAMLLAVLEKRAGLSLSSEDVFINVAGGVRLAEPAADLAVACAVASSLLNRMARFDTVVLGELGLVGEVRAISRAADRAREAHRLGFSRCLLPKANLKDIPKDLPLEAKGVSTISEAVESLL
ncbi:MAG: DNA repair protein RadA [Acidobacteria bacterium]|nr:DNA repair protein RadA [Acidobacteriota bacterium]